MKIELMTSALQHMQKTVTPMSFSAGFCARDLAFDLLSTGARIEQVFDGISR
jgi:hypothetical protein